MLRGIGMAPESELSFNERFDRFTKEKKIANLFFIAIIYFVFFLAADLLTACSLLYIRTGEIDLLYFDNFYIPALLAITGFLMLLPKVPQLIVAGITGLFTIIYSFAQCVVLNTNGTMIRFNAVFYAKEAGDFAGGAVSALPKGVIAAHIIMAAVLIAALVISARIKRPSMDKIYKVVYYSFFLVFFAVGIVLTLLYSVIKWGTSVEMAYDKFKFDNLTDPFNCFLVSDFYTYNLNDIKLMISDTFFADRYSKDIDEYFSKREQPQANDMTGILKGKNLIVVQLESVDFRPVEEGFCPNIVSLMEKSVCFENYYAVRYGNTLTFGTETAVNTSLTASTGVNLSMLGGNSFPYSLANMFSENGYGCIEYHANDGAYYSRSEMAPAYGFEKYVCLSDVIENGDAFNDLDAINDEKTYKTMFDREEPFLTYYVAFAPHEVMVGTKDMKYHLIARENHPEFADLSDDHMNNWKLRCTLTDDMVGVLMEKLEADGILDNTAILFVNDHIAITNSDAEYNDQNNLCNRVPCFLYCKDLEPMSVEKPCTQVDILPTLLNLYGIDYDKYYFGRDIFSENEGFVYFPDMSWLTDTCYYEKGSVKQVFSGGDPSEVSAEYIEQMNAEVMDRIRINNLILCSDYFADFEEKNK